MTDNLDKDVREAIERKAWIKGSIVGAISATIGSFVGQLIVRFL